MIKLLNLDAPYLVTQRKNWLDELDQLIDEHLESDDALEDLAAIDLLPTSGKLNPFFSATRQRFAGKALGNSFLNLGHKAQLLHEFLVHHSYYSLNHRR